MIVEVQKPPGSTVRYSLDAGHGETDLVERDLQAELVRRKPVLVEPLLERLLGLSPSLFSFGARRSIAVRFERRVQSLNERRRAPEELTRRFRPQPLGRVLQHEVGHESEEHELEEPCEELLRDAHRT